MPRTSAFSRPTEQGGFTLLELLVVLALLGLAAALVAPSAIRGIQQARERDFERSLALALSALPDRTAAEGRALRLDSQGLKGLVSDWPADLVVESVGGLQYAANGVAEGGAFTLRRDGRRQTWRVTPITGEPVRQP